MTGKGWIGVDLDGTLAMYESGQGIDTIGAPIKAMVQRVRYWLSSGVEVRIVTARVAACGRSNDDGVADSEEFAKSQRKMIADWTRRYIGEELESTSSKDFQMISLWDDRCVQVITNTGLAIEVTQ